MNDGQFQYMIRRFDYLSTKLEQVRFDQKVLALGIVAVVLMQLVLVILVLAS